MTRETRKREVVGGKRKVVSRRKNTSQWDSMFDENSRAQNSRVSSRELRPPRTYAREGPLSRFYSH